MLEHFDLVTLWRVVVTLFVVASIYRATVIWPRRLRAQEINLTKRSVEALTIAINAKDKITAGHVRRVQIYAEGLGRLMGCTKEERDALRQGAILHDVGKIGIPDAILAKPSKLTTDEMERMREHAEIGAEIVRQMGFSKSLVEVVRHHHERWDGTGYPSKLRGVAIPVTARILSIVDVFDAVREDRQYRKGMTRGEAIELLMQGAGTQFDPDLVGQFVTNLPLFEAHIAAERNAEPSDFGITARHEHATSRPPDRDGNPALMI